MSPTRTEPPGGSEAAHPSDGSSGPGVGGQSTDPAGADREADEIRRAGAFAEQVAPGAGGGAASNPGVSSGGGDNEQQDARRLHAAAADARNTGETAPDQTRAQDEAGSANSTSSH